MGDPPLGATSYALGSTLRMRPLRLVFRDGTTVYLGDPQPAGQPLTRTLALRWACIGAAL
jgi:hypothetical protein